jgi:hypothetical protein
VRLRVDRRSGVARARPRPAACSKRPVLGGRGLISGKGGRPNRSRNASHFTNRPDIGLTIYRKTRNATRIGCWKCRYDGVIGTLGSAGFSYDEDAARFQFAPKEDDDV